MEHVSDCERLAKQCQLWDLLDDLEAKCEKVSEFGVYVVSVQGLRLQPIVLVSLSPYCPFPQWLPSLARV